jgi:hypothetical protein
VTSQTTEYACFSSAHRAFFRQTTLGYQRSISKFKRTEMIQNMLCNPSEMKLKINNRKN